ncbi:MAG: N-acetylmuramoyl-L-alanine amidase, partial [Ferruginibacter sp.]
MKNYQLFIILPVFIFFNSCTPKPYAGTNKVYRKKAAAFAKTLKEEPTVTVTADSLKTVAWVGTINFGMRKPNMVIIHHTAQNSCEQTLKTFTTEQTQVSAHYVICKDGTLHHMLSDYLRAWQAGIAMWGSNTDINSSSIGIEIDNDGTENFTEAQLNTLLGLLDTLKKSYNIPAANFIGHADIAPVRKNDPNVNFPWKRLADKGYGLWYADTTGVAVPDNFNVTYALKIIGYDIRNSDAATKAFRR